MPLTVEVKTRGVGPTASPKLTPPRTSLLRNTPSIESISSEPTPEPNAISPPPKPENPPIRPPSSSQEEESEADQTIPPANNDVTTDADPPSSSFILSPRAALSTCNDASRFTTFTSITPMQVRNAVVVPSTPAGYVELTATAIGTVKLPIGAGRRLTLPNVLFVPLSPVSVIAGESLWGEKAGVWPGGRLVRGGKGGEEGGGGGVVVDREGRKRAWFRVVDGK